jgi:hypothetical protein
MLLDKVSAGPIERELKLAVYSILGQFSHGNAVTGTYKDKKAVEIGHLAPLWSRIFCLQLLQ